MLVREILLFFIPFCYITDEFNRRTKFEDKIEEENSTNEGKKTTQLNAWRNLLKLV